MKKIKEQSVLLADRHIPVMDRGFSVFYFPTPQNYRIPIWQKNKFFFSFFTAAYFNEKCSGPPDNDSALLFGSLGVMQHIW